MLKRLIGFFLDAFRFSLKHFVLFLFTALDEKV